MINTEDIDGARYEALVGKRAARYLPRFRRFAQGGWISWNWAAFFATLAWLRYRKLYRWSWVYFFVSTPVLLIVALLPNAGDACGAALDPMPGNVLRTAAGALIILGFLVPPLVTDRLYFNHLRRLVSDDAPAGRDATGGIAGALVLQASFFVVAAVTLPSYASYQYRARVSEALLASSATRTALQEYVKEHRLVPSRLEELGVPAASRLVSRIELLKEGTIRAVLGGEDARLLADHSILWKPSWKDGAIVSWTCESDDLPNQCLPASCRQAR